MRILIVSDSYPPLIGGATQITRHLARELDASGHDVLVATSWQTHFPSFERDGAIRIVRLRALASRLPGALVRPRYTPPPFPDPELILRLRRIVQVFKPDLIHAYGWIAGSLAVAIRRTGVPLVIAARDYANVCARRTFLFAGKSACTGPELKKCINCAAQEYGPLKGALAASSVLGTRKLLRNRIFGLHSVSSYVEHVMQAHLFAPALHSNRTIVAPDWLIENDLPPSGSSPTPKLPAEPFILFVGALRQIKGIHELLAAYARLRDRPPLVLIGTLAPDTPPIPKDVTVLHNLSHSAVMNAWRRALFGVAPSTLPEPFGNVVHEAMSVRRPVIGTTPGGHQEMIDSGYNGLLVPAGDVEALTHAMQTLVDNPALRSRLGTQALRTAQRFRRDRIVPCLIEYLERIERTYPT